MKILPSSQAAIEHLMNGEVGVMPTDTVYGLVARASDPAAVARVYALKQRERKPGTVIAASIDQLIELGVDAQVLQPVRLYWPGPFSVVLKVNADLEYLHQGLGDVAMRVPADPEIRSLLEITGPLVTTSANQPGEPVANDVVEAQAYFDDQVDFYVDGGRLEGRQPSTIVKLSDTDDLVVLRDGAIRVYPTQENCVFCLTNGQLNGEILAQSRFAYLIAANSAPGNYLIIPRQHAEQPEELEPEWWGSVQELLPKVPNLGRNYNLSFNIGKLAGQSIAHLHFWIIPRQAGQASTGKGIARLLHEADAKPTE